MMNVLFIGKYPPIQGGTASAAYWRNKELHKHGIFFDVVTCIARDSDYLIDSQLVSDCVHLLSEKTPWHIPYSQLYSEKLISKALEVAELKSFDAVEGCYLFPYGFAAYVVAGILKKPLILRHAGSDLYRISANPMFRTLLKEMTTRATCIVTYEDCVEKWKSICGTSKIFLSNRYVPNPSVFRGEGKHEGTVFMGKITEKWNREQLDYFYEYLKNNDYTGQINVYSNDYTISVFDEFFRDKEYSIIGKSFVLPDKVPAILADTKYLLVSEIPSGIPEESNIYIEGIASGCVPVCFAGDGEKKERLDFSRYIERQLAVYTEALQ